MNYINNGNVTNVCKITTLYITESLTFIIIIHSTDLHRITIFKYKWLEDLYTTFDTGRKCFAQCQSKRLSHKKPVRQIMFTNLKCLQRQKAKVGEEEARCLELLWGWRGFAVRLWVRETLGLPDFLAVPLQGVLILYLLGHQNTELVMLDFQLKRRRRWSIF